MITVSKSSGSRLLMSLPPCGGVMRRRLLLHRVVHGPELTPGRRARDAERLQGRKEALLEEPVRLLLGLPHLDHAPASVRARPRDVKDAARRLFQPELGTDLLVDLLR